MIRTSITSAAFEAVAATLPLVSVAFEPQMTANGERWVWFEDHIVNKLAAIRRLGERDSDVILRLVELEAGQRPSSPRRLTVKSCQRT